MRRKDKEEEYLKLCSETINIDAFNNIKKAIGLNSRIYFDYLAKDGFMYRYRRVIPVGFYYTTKCYLQALHELHGKKHTFRAWAISNVVLEGNLILAIIDMHKYPYLWSGETNLLESEKIG